jgi:predicted MFS family arabinose efflux permease
VSDSSPDVPISSLGRVGVLRPLRHRDFAVLWTGMTVSMIGDGIYYIAIAWQVYDLSNTPAALAVVGIAWSLPQVLFTLASGVLSDRLDRRRVMIAGDLIRLVALSAICALSVTGNITIPLLIALVALYGTGQAVFQPSFNAIVPMIVPAELLVEANSLAQFVRPAAMSVLGPVIGGLLIGAVGPGWAFGVDAATFAFSAAMILLIRTQGRAARDAEEPSSPWQDLKEGIRFVKNERWLLVGLLGALVSLLAAWGPWETLVPFVVRNDLSGSATELGLVFGAGGIGSLAAALIVGQRGRLPRKAITTIYLSWAIALFAMIGLGIAQTVWQAMLVALVSEGSLTVLIVLWYTVMQRLVPEALLGRVSSLDWMMTTAGVPLSFAIVGPAAAAFGARAVLVVAGILGGAVTLAFMFVPGARDPERDGRLADVSLES